MRILLVDDEAELVSTLTERLSFRGIEADWATTAEEALEKADKQKYDVAVLDVKIPRISGLALKKLLEEKDPGLKFIFLTGHGSEEDFKIGSAEAGEAYYLIKPVDLNLLIEKLKEITNS
ncbi:MAG: response regulator transcription factor [Deltaproteobacteria bacterium]|nr:response regulator transcription factor [Deltaproteobacteria bacterium]